MIDINTVVVASSKRREVVEPWRAVKVNSVFEFPERSESAIQKLVHVLRYDVSKALNVKPFNKIREVVLRFNKCSRLYSA